MLKKTYILNLVICSLFFSLPSFGNNTKELRSCFDCTSTEVRNEANHRLLYSAIEEVTVVDLLNGTADTYAKMWMENDPRQPDGWRVFRTNTPNHIEQAAVDISKDSREVLRVEPRDGVNSAADLIDEANDGFVDSWVKSQAPISLWLSNIDSRLVGLIIPAARGIVRRLEFPDGSKVSIRFASLDNKEQLFDIHVLIETARDADGNRIFTSAEEYATGTFRFFSEAAYNSFAGRLAGFGMPINLSWTQVVAQQGVVRIRDCKENSDGSITCPESDSRD